MLKHFLHFLILFDKQYNQLYDLDNVINWHVNAFNFISGVGYKTAKYSNLIY